MGIRDVNPSILHILERINTAKRYHWWIVYQMATERPHDMILEPKKKQEHMSIFFSNYTFFIENAPPKTRFFDN